MLLFPRKNGRAPGKIEQHKTAAAAMLARVYMTLAGFPFNDASAMAKAKSYLSQVLTKKANYWAPTIDEWRKQWTPDYANKYSIFAIQYRSGGTGNPALFNMTKSVPPTWVGSVRIFGNDIYLEKTLRFEFNRVYSGGNKDLRGELYTLLDEHEAEGSTLAHGVRISSICLRVITTPKELWPVMWLKVVTSMLSRRTRCR